MIKLIKEFSFKQFEWRNDPELWPTVRQNGPIAKAQHEEWCEMALREHYFGIEVSEDSKIKGFIRKPEIVGYCGLSNIRERTAEYSMLIGPEYRGKGYATEALRKLILYGFDTLDLFVIWGEIMDGNESGLRIAEKVGFKFEGTLRARYYKNGTRKNSQVYSLIRSDYGT